MNVDIKKKAEKLEEAKKKLKDKFVGIDDIIDRVVEYLSPWYLTPEILERPVVISLFGMTGTGKTQLVRNLLDYLELTKDSLFFDCGEFVSVGGDYKFANKIMGEFEDYSTMPRTSCFVMDEFQCLRTKGEMGEEIDRPESRAIWTLVDSGILDVSEFDRGLRDLTNYLDDLTFFSKDNPDLKITNGHFLKETNKILKKTIGHYRWYDDYPEKEGNNDKTKDKDLGFEIFSQFDHLNYIRRRLSESDELSYSEFQKELNSLTNLSDLLSWFKQKYLGFLSSPKIIDCSHSVVFVLGNIDEAFTEIIGETDPDVSADVYKEITSKVNIVDIKEALSTRFRDEQIGRLGNNIVIYPSLGENDFKIVINKTLSELLIRFKERTNIEVGVSDSIKKFLYKEGVYPTQGVRPILTTISSIITPRLSEILVNCPEECTRVYIDTDEEKFEVSSVKVLIRFFDGDSLLKTMDRDIRTTLGDARKLSRGNKLGVQAIHEAGHSVIYSLLTGEFPEVIVASSLSGGGYMMTKPGDKQAMSIREYENEVLVLLAGYYSERHFYSPDLCTLGASSDIKSAWEIVSYAVLECGFISPEYYSHMFPNSKNRVSGLDWMDNKKDQVIKGLFNKYELSTQKLIGEEEVLIREVGKYLEENRCMSSKIFGDYIDKYGATFSTESMKKKREENTKIYKI